MTARKILAAALLLVATFTLGGCCLCSIWTRNFEKYECRSKQSEAKANLRALFVAEESYRSEHGKYAPFDVVGFAPQGETLRYDYALVEVDDAHFVAEARGKDEQAGDIWRIDNTNALTNVANVCGGSQG